MTSCKKEFYEKTIKRFEEDATDAFIKTQLEWLGLEETYSPENYIDADCKNKVKSELNVFLSSYCDRIVTDTDEIKSIRKRVGDDYHTITKTKWDNHLNRLPGSEKMCELLRTLGLPYSIELEKNSKQLEIYKLSNAEVN